MCHTAIREATAEKQCARLVKDDPPASIFTLRNAIKHRPAEESLPAARLCTRVWRPLDRSRRKESCFENGAKSKIGYNIFHPGPKIRFQPTARVMPTYGTRVYLPH